MEPLYITIAILAVISIVFLIAWFKSFSTTHWLHLVLVLLTFASTIAGGIVLSRSYKIRGAWQKRYYENEAALKKVTEEYQVARDGPIESTAPDLNSVHGAKSALAIETFGQGRVWSNGTPEVQGENIVVTLSTLPPENNRGFVNDQPASQLQPQMLVYVYRDAPIPDSIYNDPTNERAKPMTPPSPALSGPTMYLGVMQVVSVAGNRVTLQHSDSLNIQERRLQRDPQGQIVLQDGVPVIESAPIFPAIAQEFASPSTTWTLFEKVPIDERDAFKRLRQSLRNVNPLGETTDFDAYQAEYRAELKTYMPPEALGLDVNQADQAARYEALLDRYAFDQMRMTDITQWIDRHEAERVNASFDPPSDERFLMIRFKSASANEYEVDTNTGNVRETGAFDAYGRAVLNILWASPDGKGKIRMEEGDVVVVDRASLDKLNANNEPIDMLGEVYVRRLIDYPLSISTLNSERERLFDVLIRLVDEIETLKATDASLVAQERQRAKVSDELTQDKANLDGDVQAIESLRDKRVSEIVALKEEINRLHKVIGARYVEIKQRSEALLNTSR
jgi:hypothetical protein